jgi:hypothetical protein
VWATDRVGKIGEWAEGSTVQIAALEPVSEVIHSHQTESRAF